MGYLNVFYIKYFVGKNDDIKLNMKQRVKFEDIMVVNVFIGIMKIVFKKEDCDIKKLNSILFFYLLF